MTAPAIRGIYHADVSADPELGRHRSRKHCVCVSVGSGLYLLVNTAHRELYNDFQIKASDYAFLSGVDRFISCHKPKEISTSSLIQRVGTLSNTDTRTVIAKIKASRAIPENDKTVIISELSATL